MLVRITAGIIGAVIVLALLSLPQPIPLILIGLAWLFCLYEFSLFVKKPALVLEGLASSAFLLLVLAWIFFKFSPKTQNAFIAIFFAFQIASAIYILEEFRKGRTALKPGYVVLVMTLLISFPFFALAILSKQEGAPVLLLLILALAWVGDVSAIFAGRAFGKIHIVPKLSPGKTLEGLIGGIAGTIAYIFVLGWLFRLGAVHKPLILVSAFTGLSVPSLIIATIFLGVVLALAGFFGDITVSAVKRIYSKKDTGTFLPGHGGLWDRVDSLLFIAPLALILVSILNFLATWE